MDENKKTKKIRSGDRVIAISGNERGQAGTVLRIIGERAVVQGLNVKKKHVKPSQANAKGSIISIERPIHISNLCACTENNERIKLRIRENDSGSRELYYMLDGKEILYRSIKKQTS